MVSRRMRDMSRVGDIVSHRGRDMSRLSRDIVSHVPGHVPTDLRHAPPKWDIVFVAQGTCPTA